MNRVGSARVAIACVIALAGGRTGAQGEFTQLDLTETPYAMPAKGLDPKARADKHDKLASLAEGAGDYARAARHYAKACEDRSDVNFDAKLSDASCARARDLAQQHSVVDVSIQLRVLEGTVRVWAFDFPGAINLFRDAVKLGEGLNPELPDNQPVIGAHQMLGAVQIERGEFDEARRMITFARDHCRAYGNLPCVIVTENNLCRLLTMLGDYGAARTACDTAAAAIAIDNDNQALVNLGWNRGTLYLLTDRNAEALAVLEDAWARTDAPDTEFMKPILAQLMTDALIKLGRLDEAEQWQNGTEQGLRDRKIPFFYGPQIAMRRAKISVARGKLDEAQAGYMAASRSLIHEMSIRGFLGMANVSRQRGDLPASRSALEDAIARIEKSRTNTSGAALRATYLTLHAHAYNELIGVRWDADGANAASDALQIAEKGRARGLLDALMSAQVKGAAASTLDAAAVQATLSADQVLIEYVSLDTRMFALTVTRDRIAFTPLPNAGTADDLAKRVDFFSTLAQESDEAALVPAAKRLYADLLAPALEGVPASAHTLIIAADGPLHRLPFDALGDAPRVIDRWDVVTIPSASALASRVSHAAPTEAALIVAAPADASGRGMLAAAPAEADAIRSRIGGRVSELTGVSATPQQLEAEGLGKFAVLHFASHAVVDASKPLQSALILAPSAADSDRRWTAEEIYRTPLNADLVVLSACSTAAGVDTPGEGVMSLSRAFLYAGAGATIATLWDVPDAPGPVFADVLYDELSHGRTLGAATADARRELRRRGAPPQAWAAYVLTGKPGAVVGITPGTNRSIVRAGIAGGLAAVLLLMALVLRSAAKALWRFRWPAPALASAVLIVFAAIQFLPVTPARLDAASRTSRGAARATINTTIAPGKFAWVPVAGADQHSVEMFDAGGVPTGPPINATSPFDLPASASGGWIRVTALLNGQPMAQSALIPITRH